MDKPDRFSMASGQLRARQEQLESALPPRSITPSSQTSRNPQTFDNDVPMPSASRSPRKPKKSQKSQSPMEHGSSNTRRRGRRHRRTGCHDDEDFPDDGIGAKHLQTQVSFEPRNPMSIDDEYQSSRPQNDLQMLIGSSNIKRVTSENDDYGLTNEKRKPTGLVPQQLETLNSQQSNSGGVVLPSFCLNQRNMMQSAGQQLSGSFNQQYSSMRFQNQSNGGNKDSSQKSNSIIPQEQLQMIQDLDTQLKRMQMDLLTHQGAPSQARQPDNRADGSVHPQDGKLANQQLPIQPNQNECVFSFRNTAKGGALGTSQALSIGHSNCNNTLNVTSLGSNHIPQTCLFEAQSSMSELEKILKEGYQSHHLHQPQILPQFASADGRDSTGSNNQRQNSHTRLQVIQEDTQEEFQTRGATTNAQAQPKASVKADRESSVTRNNEQINLKAFKEQIETKQVSLQNQNATKPPTKPLQRNSYQARSSNQQSSGSSHLQTVRSWRDQKKAAAAGSGSQSNRLPYATRKKSEENEAGKQRSHRELLSKQSREPDQMLNLRYHKHMEQFTDAEEESEQRRETAVLPMSFGAEQPEEQNADTTIATNDINTITERNDKESQQDQNIVSENYVKIFQSLLQQALKAQQQFIECSTQSRQGHLDSTQFPPSSRHLIDPATTGSFKDLCQKLIDLLTLSNEQLLTKQFQIDKIEKDLQNHAMELEEKNLEQQQMQVLIDQVKEHQRSLDIANQEREKLLNGYHEENLFMKEKLQQYENHFHAINAQEAKIKQVLESNNQQIVQKDETVEDLQQRIEAMQEDLDKAIKNSTDLQQRYNQAQDRISQLTEAERCHSDSATHEKKRSSDLTRQVSQLLTQVQEANAKRMQASTALENLQTMFNLNKDESAKKAREIEQLKLTIEQQIKEGLEVEAKLKAKIGEAERHIEELKRSKQDKEERLRGEANRFKKEKEEIERRAQAMREEQREWMDKQIEDVKARLAKSDEAKKQLQIDLHTLQGKHDEAQNSILKHQSDLKQSLLRNQEQEAQIEQLRQSEIKVKEELGQVKFENANLNGAINNYKETLQEVDGLDIQIHLVSSPDGGYQVDDERKKGKRGDSKRRFSSTKASNTSSEMTRGSRTLLDRSAKFANQFQGVHSFTQSIGQAKVIEKFLKQHFEDQKTIKQFHESQKALSDRLQDFELKMNAIQNEKAMLEQLILEILSFGEQCDLQFEQLQHKVGQLSTAQRKQSRFDEDFVGRLRQSLTDKVKAIIVDVEDKRLRDNMIEVLSCVGMYQTSNPSYDPLSTDYDHTIFENAFLKVIESLGKNAIAQEKRISELHEQVEAKEQIAQQLARCENDLHQQTQNLEDAKELCRKMRGQFHDHDIFIKKIQTTMREHKYIIKTNSNLVESQTTGNDILDRYLENDVYAEANKQMMSFDAMCRQLPKDLEQINEWAQDQIILLQNFICDREKLVKVNLKCNDLAQENSKLKIENDKQRLINEKYRNSVILRTDQSPQTKISYTQRSNRSRFSDLVDGRRPVASHETQRSDERLHRILSKVQLLKNENDPSKVLYNRYDQPKNSSRRNEQQKSKRDSQIRLFEKRDPSLDHNEPSNRSAQNRHPHDTSLANIDRHEDRSCQQRRQRNGSLNDSYYDHKGSFDLVRKFGVEKYHRDKRAASKNSRQSSVSRGGHSSQKKSVRDRSRSGRSSTGYGPQRCALRKKRSSTPNIMDKSSNVFAHTIHNDQLQSYRRGSNHSREGDQMQRTSSFIPSFAQTQLQHNQSDMGEPRSNALLENEPNQSMQYPQDQSVTYQQYCSTLENQQDDLDQTAEEDMNQAYYQPTDNNNAHSSLIVQKSPSLDSDPNDSQLDNPEAFCHQNQPQHGHPLPPAGSRFHTIQSSASPQKLQRQHVAFLHHPADRRGGGRHKAPRQHHQTHRDGRTSQPIDQREIEELNQRCQRARQSDRQGPLHKQRQHNRSMMELDHAGLLLGNHGHPPPGSELYHADCAPGQHEGYSGYHNNSCHGGNAFPQHRPQHDTNMVAAPKQMILRGAHANMTQNQAMHMQAAMNAAGKRGRQGQEGRDHQHRHQDLSHRGATNQYPQAPSGPLPSNALNESKFSINEHSQKGSVAQQTGFLNQSHATNQSSYGGGTLNAVASQKMLQIESLLRDQQRLMEQMRRKNSRDGPQQRQGNEQAMLGASDMKQQPFRTERQDANHGHPSQLFYHQRSEPVTGRQMPNAQQQLRRQSRSSFDQSNLPRPQSQMLHPSYSGSQSFAHARHESEQYQPVHPQMLLNNPSSSQISNVHPSNMLENLLHDQSHQSLLLSSHEVQPCDSGFKDLPSAHLQSMARSNQSPIFINTDSHQHLPTFNQAQHPSHLRHPSPLSHLLNMPAPANLAGIPDQPLEFGSSCLSPSGTLPEQSHGPVQGAHSHLLSMAHLQDQIINGYQQPVYQIEDM